MNQVKRSKYIALILAFLTIFNILIPINKEELYVQANAGELNILFLAYFEFWQDPSTGKWLFDDESNKRKEFEGPSSTVYSYDFPSVSVPNYKIKAIQPFNRDSDSYHNLQRYTSISDSEIIDYMVNKYHLNNTMQHIGKTGRVTINSTFDSLSLNGSKKDQVNGINVYRNYVPVVVTLELDSNLDTVIAKYQDESGKTIKSDDKYSPATQGTFTVNAANITGYDLISPSDGRYTLDISDKGEEIVVIFIYKLQSGVEPPVDPGPVDPVEPPPKPDVDKPDVDIWIVPRDDDPTTPSNQIYEGESIRIKGFASGGSNIRWRFFAKNANQSGDGFIDGLFPTDDPDSGAYAVQRARYTDFAWNPETLSYEETNATAEESVSFKVKEIKPPVIEIEGLTDSNINIVHLKEPTEIKTTVYDINEPSEQHPEGFDVIGESWSFIKKSTGEVVLSGTGVLNEDEFIFRKGIFETEEYYTLRTTAYNAFRPIRRTEKDIEIYVENLPPLVELKVVSEDGEAPTFAREEFDVVVDAVDGDGFIAKVDFEILDNYPELSYLGRKTIIPLGNEMYRANYRYVSDIANVVTFRVTATDDRGLNTTLDIKENIVRPTLYADIEVENEHDIQKKVYRYIGLDFTGSYSNAPFPIDHKKSKIKYRFNDGEWENIDNIGGYNDDNIRIHYPNYPVKDKLEMYAKKEGKVEFSLQVFDTKDFDSDEIYKTLLIDPDEAPVVNYEIESMQHRITENDVKDYKDRSKAITEENIGKGYIKVIDKSKSNDGDKLRGKVFYLVYDVQNDGIDNDLEHMVVITEDPINGYDSDTEIVLNVEETNIVKVKDLNNAIITFLTQKDGLGDYYIKAKVQEEITQLPSENSPLYNEILQHELTTISEYSNVFIDNLLPTITFEIGIDREINVIVHYDDYIPSEMQEKINELVANLESRGLKVRLTKYENKY
ncbi:MucBP domain-containing protein [Alkaliphilus sp. MSJ-5]|uniref:MucBP domain-containing protein n=1 Tax=Alkaliphilus flagellatus TaxID=2841507 RepID=A0ABS6G396_9FIRM|nr:MucBP domain-containing protein [Alkaliphilus flagellatus]MBU5676833.1 MucBP domain-containing protein [Alkaliphilus flagellatus]